MARRAELLGGGGDWREQVERMRADAAAMPAGAQRDALLVKADQLWAAYLMAESFAIPKKDKH